MSVAFFICLLLTPACPFVMLPLALFFWSSMEHAPR